MDNCLGKIYLFNWKQQEGNFVHLILLKKNLNFSWKCSPPFELFIIIFCFIEDWPQGYKTLFMLNSTEHEISTDHKN